MTLDDAGRRILAEYERLAQTGRMDSRYAILLRTGLGWGRFLEAHHYMVNHQLAAHKLAIRYDPRLRLWTAGAERFNAAAGYDESKEYVGWHTRYLKTRTLTSGAHLEAIGEAFPARKRQLRPLRRYLENAAAELDEVLDRV